MQWRFKMQYSKKNWGCCWYCWKACSWNKIGQTLYNTHTHKFLRFFFVFCFIFRQNFYETMDLWLFSLNCFFIYSLVNGNCKRRIKSMRFFFCFHNNSLANVLYSSSHICMNIHTAHHLFPYYYDLMYSLC